MSEINIITRGEDNRLFDIYNICWKKPIGVSERFNYEEIAKFI